MDTMNTNLLPVSQRAYKIVEELNNAQVTILSMRIDMDYNTPCPHLFRFYIHAWNDQNFDRWAGEYLRHVDMQRHEIQVRFVNGMVYALND